jgi:hypothetical protein
MRTLGADRDANARTAASRLSERTLGPAPHLTPPAADTSQGERFNQLKGTGLGKQTPLARASRPIPYFWIPPPPPPHLCRCKEPPFCTGWRFLSLVGGCSIFYHLMVYYVFDNIFFNGTRCPCRILIRPDWYGI